MKRGIGFGKIGMNLGNLKLADKPAEKDGGEASQEDKGGGESADGGGGFGGFGKITAPTTTAVASSKVINNTMTEHNKQV